MTNQRIRHLPVIDERGLCGIVTIGDLMAHGWASTKPRSST